MRRLLLACAAIALLGCGGGDSVGPPADVAGTWNLQTINGQSLPFLFDPGPPTTEFVSDVVQVNADGTYTETSHIRETDGATVTESDEVGSGTFAVRGNTVDFHDSTTGNIVTGTVDGDTMSIHAGLTLVYSRQ